MMFFETTEYDTSFLVPGCLYSPCRYSLPIAAELDNKYEERERVEKGEVFLFVEWRQINKEYFAKVISAKTGFAGWVFIHNGSFGSGVPLSRIFKKVL